MEQVVMSASLAMSIDKTGAGCQMENSEKPHYWLSSEAGGLQIQGLPGLHSRFKASLRISVKPSTPVKIV